MERITKRIGLIVPANNSVIEPELWSRAPPDAAFYATRILAKGELTPDAVIRMESHVERAVNELEATGVDVIAYADMVTSFVMQPGWNEERTSAVTARTGIACVSAWTAMRDALALLDPSGIALATPYPADLHALACPFFEANGLKIVADGTLDIRNMSEVHRVTTNRLTELVDSLDVKLADIVVILATDLPTIDAIEELEERFGLPVLSSNQVLLRSVLTNAGHSKPISGIGRLGSMTIR